MYFRLKSLNLSLFIKLCLDYGSCGETITDGNKKINVMHWWRFFMLCAPHFSQQFQVCHVFTGFPKWNKQITVCVTQYRPENGLDAVSIHQGRVTPIYATLFFLCVFFCIQAFSLSHKSECVAVRLFFLLQGWRRRVHQIISQNKRMENSFLHPAAPPQGGWHHNKIIPTVEREGGNSHGCTTRWVRKERIWIFGSR